jgi:hypothetical protein
VNSIFNAVLEINPDALAIAAALDLERTNGNGKVFLYIFDYILSYQTCRNDDLNLRLQKKLLITSPL